MGADLLIETVTPRALDGDLRARWNTFRKAQPAFRSPYFDLRYLLAAGDAAPGAEVAVISRGGRVVGFLPFQRRGTLIQPFAAPLTDYHGLLSAPGETLDLRAVIGGLGARRFRFESLVAPPEAAPDSEVRHAMVADLSAGFEAYAERRPAGFLKDKRRRARRLAEDHGALEFSFGTGEAGLLEIILRRKRDQMRRTGQHDIFTSPWTERLLRRLGTVDDADFGLRYAVLRAGGQIVAAEVGLRSGDAYHLWLPIYEPSFARYSPGALMTLEMLRAAPRHGLRTVDFGSAGERYKIDFADPAGQVLAGQVLAKGLGRGASGVADRALAAVPRLQETLSAAQGRLERRWDRIAACEPGLEGRTKAAAHSLGRLGRRHPKTSIGLGAGLGAGLGLLALIAD